MSANGNTMATSVIWLRSNQSFESITTVNYPDDLIENRFTFVCLKHSVANL